MYTASIGNIYIVSYMYCNVLFYSNNITINDANKHKQNFGRDFSMTFK